MVLIYSYLFKSTERQRERKGGKKCARRRDGEEVDASGPQATLEPLAYVPSSSGDLSGDIQRASALKARSAEERADGGARYSQRSCHPVEVCQRVDAAEPAPPGRLTYFSYSSGTGVGRNRHQHDTFLPYQAGNQSEIRVSFNRPSAAVRLSVNVMVDAKSSPKV